jgi:hypothetical protein
MPIYAIFLKLLDFLKFNNRIIEHKDMSIDTQRKTVPSIIVPSYSFCTF